MLDWFSRFVVSWELSQSLEIDFVLVAIESALQQSRPEICNTDQGSQFTSPQFTKMMLQAGAKVSIPTQFARYWAPRCDELAPLGSPRDFPTDPAAYPFNNCEVKDA